MSSHFDVLEIKIEPNEVRDYFQTDEGTATKYYPIWEKDGAVILDWHVWNRGASSLTVTLDDTFDITIPSGADRGFDNVKLAAIKVTTTVAYTIAIAGVRKYKKIRTEI